MGVVVVEAIEVGDHDIRVRVRIDDAALQRTAARPDLAERALGVLPGLARHTCDNDADIDFTRELRDTETAHLLEHVTMEVAALAGSPRSLHADTSWDFSADGRGVYRLRFDFDDDLVVLGALSEGVDIVEWLMTGSGERPDVAAAAVRLKALRG